MHVILLGGEAQSLLNFRGPLIVEMVQRGWRVTAAASNFDITTRAGLEALGAKPVEVSMARTGMNPLSDLAYRRTLIALFRRERPDVLLAYTIKPVIWGLLAARAARVPRSVALITGLGYAFTDGLAAGLKRWLAGFMASALYWVALKQADRVLFQNPDDRNLFLSRRIIVDHGQICVVDGSGVDLVHYAPAPPPGRPSFLMLARLLRAKGVTDYAEAARRLKARHPEVEFRLAGPFDSGPDGVRRTEVDEWVKGGVRFLGILSDVRPALAEAAVYVLPSYYREGTPRSILEALAIGRPIITTNAPGCRETVVDGSNGFLIAPRDVDALEVAMERFILEPGLILRMGQASLELAQTKYDVHRVNAQVLHAVSG